jgi:NtrC-family two-component system sensor histidine kinase KinB
MEAKMKYGGLITAWDTLRVKLLGLAPVARDTLVESMSDSVLVLDAQDRVVDLNSAARCLLGVDDVAMPSHRVIGQPVRALWPELVVPDRNVPEARVEWRLDQTPPRYLDVQISPLRDRRGRLEGRLVVLRDITGHKQAEEAWREQSALAESLRDTAAVLNSTLDLDQVLDRILENIERVVPHEAADIMLLDDEGKWAQVVRERGYVLSGREGLTGTPVGTTASPLRVADFRSLQQMIESGRPVVISDTSSSPVWVDLEQTRWLHSYIGAPIRLRGKVVGFLNLNSATIGFFTDAHAERLQAFADQAAIAIENARVFQLTRQHVQRQVLINEVSAAVNRPIELQAVLQVTVAGLAQALNIGQVSLSLFGETRQHLIVMADHAAPGHLPAIGLRIPMEGNRAMQQTLDTQTPLAIEDAQHDPLTSSMWDVLAQHDVHSMLIVPIVARDLAVGTITCNAIKAPRNFSSDEIELAQIVANLAAVRIEQARLFEAERIARHQAQQRALDLSGLYSITRATSRSLDLGDVLSQALTSALASLQFDVGYIALVAEVESEARSVPPRLQLRSERGMSADICAQLDQSLENTLAERVCQRRQIVVLDAERTSGVGVVPDAPGADAASPTAGGSDGFETSGWSAYIGVPLIYQEQTLGALCLFSRQPHQATSQSLAFLDSVGQQIATAAINAQFVQATLNERSRLRSLIESNRDGIVLTGLDGRILVANTPVMEMLRLADSPSSWLGRPLSEALWALRRSAPEAATVARAELRRARSEAHAQSVNEGEFKVPPRVIHWLSLPVRVGLKSLGRLVVLRDMTNERAVERLRDDMTHAMVHDLRNPLTGVAASLGLLISGAAGTVSPAQREILEIADRSARRMTELVNAILDVNRLESGRMPLHRKLVAINLLAMDVIQMEAAVAGEKGIRTESDVPLSLPSVWADEALIRRVLQNLIGNAIKFTPPGGLVCVSARSEDKPKRQVVVSVSDTGAGIPLEIQPRLFQKFAAGEQEEHGSGLGLAFCKLAVEAHKGRIWVESTSEQGTTIAFSLAATEGMGNQAP